jgi:soluble lytic murein transglycosylase-like protein
MSTFSKIFSVLAIAILLTSVVHGKQIQPSIEVKSEQVVAQPEPEVPLSPVEYADKYTKYYGVDPTIFKKVMFCESSNNPKAFNKNDPNGGSFGVMQFQIATFYSYANKLKIEKPDIHNVEQQIKVASYMFSIGQMRQWSCARNLGFVK